jgi:tetratricopeptide (TPR) repeat protein
VRSHISVLMLSLSLLTACTGMKAVQLHPPIAPPDGIEWGYGTAKLQGKDVERVRQAAYSKAINDLLTRGPVPQSYSPAIESAFRLHAPELLQPSFTKSGTQDGYLWILVGASADETEQGWQRFLGWRADKIAQAERLYDDARGVNRAPLLKESFSMLNEAAAQDDAGVLYYEVKAAMDREVQRVTNLEQTQSQFHAFVNSGHLAAAEEALDRALDLGLETPLYVQYKTEVSDRRKQCTDTMLSGDALARNEQYDAARTKYEEALQLDRDNPLLATRIASLDQQEKGEHKDAAARVSVSAVGVGVTKIINSFLDHKREEKRKREEEKKKEAEQKEAEKKATAKETEKPEVAPPAAPAAVPPASPQPPAARRDPLNPMPVPEL